MFRELLDEINNDDIKLEKENYIPNKYINMIHGIEIIKIQNKECIYCRKNGKRKITNDTGNECKISICPKYNLSYHNNYVYLNIIK